MKQRRIPTLIGIIVLTFSVACGVLLVSNKQIFKLGASSSVTPKDIRISNVTDGSLTVSWVTDKEVLGSLKWSKSESAVLENQNDEINGLSYTHSSTIRGLSPQTTYYLKINSSGVDFDNNGVSWQVKTGPKLTSGNKEILVSGSVQTQAGKPVKGGLIYLSVGGGSLVSTTTSDNGTWVTSLGSVRTQNLASLVKIDGNATLIEIYVTSGISGVATAQIYPQSAKPAPPIILGNVHDFKNLPPSVSGENTQATLNIPETEKS